MKVNCLVCGKEINAFPSKIPKYCSIGCAAKGKTKPKGKCPVCGKDVNRFNTKYCSLKCFHSSIKGVPQPNRWKRIEKICKQCGKVFIAGGRSGKRVGQKFCSLECTALSNRKSFEEHHCLTDSANWKDLRNEVVKRDGNKCFLCNNAEGKLEVHHIIPRSVASNHQKANLVTLCGRCHYAVEILTGVGYKNRKDFDPNDLLKMFLNY